MPPFWRDDDGFSIIDCISIVTLGAYIILIFMGVFFNNLTSNIQELLEYLKVPVTIVLTGFFSKSVIGGSIDKVYEVKLKNTLLSNKKGSDQ